MNLGLRGVSASFGVPGATVNVSGRGVKGTVGIPGSGLSYSAALASAAKPIAPLLPEPDAKFWEPPSIPAPYSPASEPYIRPAGTREIGSAAIETLTSAGLLDFRQMIIDARTQRGEISSDLTEARSEHRARREELGKRQRSIFRWLFKKRIAELEHMVPKLSAEVDRLAAWLEATHIEVTFEAPEAAQRSYGAVVRAYDTLRSCGAIWDVTSDRDVHKVAERTVASRAIERRTVTLDYSTSDLIRFSGKALRFANANGDDIMIYPGLMLMPRSDGQFALLDVREVTVEATSTRFIEEQSVPSDSLIVGRTWAKVNKDGSPDRRFKENYEIPICLYGEMRFTSQTGLTEEYQFSNANSAIAFAQAFADYKIALLESAA